MHSKGFTLIQISMLLTVASLVLVAILPSSQSRLTNDNITEAKLNYVLNSLRNYEAANGKLPCPGDASMGTQNANYGFSASNSGITSNCGGGGAINANDIDATHNIAMGSVPYKTLGIPVDYSFDGYGRNIKYAVDTNATVCGWTSYPLPGTIGVADNNGTTVNANTVGLLLSEGANGHGAYTPVGSTGATGTASKLNAGITSTTSGELTNAHVDASFNPTSPYNPSFIKQPSVGAPAASIFDDMIVYKNSNWTLNSLPTTSPTINNISVPADANYLTGGLPQPLTFTVNWSAPVTVTTAGPTSTGLNSGTPRLQLTIGSNTEYAYYTAASGTATVSSMQFSYSPVAGDVSGSGISLSPQIYLNGGTIASGSFCIPYGFTVPSLTGVLVNATGIFLGDSSDKVVSFIVPGGSAIAVTGLGSEATMGGAANATSIAYPAAIAVDSSGNWYVADSSEHVVMKVTLSTGIITKVAGTYGSSGSSGTGSPAISAKLNAPSGVAVDSSGNVYISDTKNHAIRMVSATSPYNISTYEGTLGTAASSGTSTTLLKSPGSLTIDSTGNLYVSDAYYRIMKVPPGGGTMTMVAGTGSTGNGGYGIAATTSPITTPNYLAVNPAGTTLYISDYTNDKVRAVAIGGNVTSFVNTSGGSNWGCSALTNATATSMKTENPQGITMDTSGNVYFLDTDSLYEVTSGKATTIAGTCGNYSYSGMGGPAINATMGTGSTDPMAWSNRGW